MSTALDHELEEAERRKSSAAVPRHPRPLVEPEAAPIEATPASSWKRDEPELHNLPSGNAAMLMRPRTAEMIKRGEIPNPILGIAIAAASGSALPEDVDYVEVQKFTDFMVASAFVEPRVSLEEDPPEGELPISALSDADRNYVLIWAQRGVAGLARFRLDGAGPASGGDGGDVRDEAE
jgi:hypothetical protein